MEAIRLLSAVLFCSALVQGAPFGDDDRLQACYDKCYRSKACKGLDSKPKRKVDSCMEFLYEKCVEAKNTENCLGALESTKKGDCTNSILKSAIPCVKCEIDCEYDYYYDDDDDEDDDDRDNDLSESEKKCSKKCDNTDGCIALDGASKAQINRCEKYTNKMCDLDDDDDIIDCLEKLKSTESAKCPKAFRKKALKCRKCEDSCIDSDDDEDDAAEQKCYQKCTATQSCQLFNAATENRIKNCKKLTQRKCPGDEDDIPKCLVKIKDVSDVKCPREFRKHALACMTCDFSCTDQSSTTLPDSRPNFEADEEQCLSACDETIECKTFDSASDEASEACIKFVSDNCEDEDDAATCMNKLGEPPSNCPPNVLKTMFSCMMCEENCDEKHGETIGSGEQACLDDCSMTASCTAMDSATDEALENCEELFDKICGNSEDSISCMEAYTEQDETCPVNFRTKINECMKCDEKCEGAPSPSPNPGEQACLDKCSMTSSCVAMENTADEALNMCQMLFEKICASSDDPLSCMEAHTEQDETCPIALRTKINECMKCDEGCKGSIPSPPHNMTKATCEANCESAQGCSNGGNITPECNECFAATCPGPAPTNCRLKAFAGVCFTKCVQGVSTQKEKCNACKADCASLP